MSLNNAGQIRYISCVPIAYPSVVAEPEQAVSEANFCQPMLTVTRPNQAYKYSAYESKLISDDPELVDVVVHNIL
jgi:hypothetical protein